MYWRFHSVAILLGSEYYVAHSFVLLLSGIPQLGPGTSLDGICKYRTGIFLQVYFFFSCETAHIGHQMCYYPKPFLSWCDETELQ